MCPFITIGNLEVPMYGLMVCIGIYLGFIYAYFRVYQKEKMSRAAGVRLAFCCVLGGIAAFAGAFFFDALFHSVEEGKLSFGGITYLGGVVVGLPVAVFLIGRLVPGARGRALYVTSLLMPSVVLAHGFGRIGCFCAGCCYGRETDAAIGVLFPGMAHKVIPTQLIEAAAEFVLFLLMAFLNKKIKGHQLEIYLLAYGAFRFVLEFFRGDSRGSVGLWFSPAQLLCLLCVAAATLLFARNRKSNIQKPEKEMEQ